jgi:hypothetical protein
MNQPSASAWPLPPVRDDLHLSESELDAGFSNRPSSPTSSGKITLLLTRPASGQRMTPNQVFLGIDSGMPDDCWSQLPVSEKTANMQLSVMETSVGELIANGQDPCLFGDNLMVDLDISEQNLPVGSVLQAGEARLEVTPEPHTGCAQYQQRFGAPALRYISKPDRREQRLRGVYMKVVQQGVVAVGDLIRVLSR